MRKKKKNSEQVARFLKTKNSQKKEERIKRKIGKRRKTKGVSMKTIRSKKEERKKKEDMIT